MALAPTTEQQSQRTDLGHRFFLLGVFAILVVEVLATLVNIGQAFEWTGTLLGIVASVLILFLGNWLYTGDKTALTAARVWVGLQLALVVVALVILLGDAPPNSPLPRHLNISAAWQGWLKLAAYAGFGAALLLPGVVLDFFAAQRGEAPAVATAPTVEVVAAVGEPTNLTTEHTLALEGLGGAMKTVSGVLVLVGAFELLSGLLTLTKNPTGSTLTIVEGMAIAALGAVLLGPLQALQSLLAASPRNMGHVMGFLTRLSTTFTAYLAILVVLAAVVICRIVL